MNTSLKNLGSDSLRSLFIGLSEAAALLRDGPKCLEEVPIELVGSLIERLEQTGRPSEGPAPPVYPAGALPLDQLVRAYARFRAGVFEALELAGRTVSPEARRTIDEFVDASLTASVDEFARSLQASNELMRKFEERFERVARATDLGVWYCDLPFADLIWADKVKEHFWLSAEAHVTIDTFYERIHPDDRERTRLAIAHSNLEHAPYDIVYRTTNPANEKEWKWIRAIGWTDYDAQGNPSRFDGITLDVTREQESREAMRKSEERYSLASRATKDAIWDWDLLTNGTAWNEAVATEYGYPPDVMNGDAHWWYENIHPEDRERVVAGIHEVIDEVGGSTSWSAQYRFLKADGSYANILDRGHIARDTEGRAVRMIGAMQDITQQVQSRQQMQKLTEDLTEALRSRDEFLSIASHELKTPLSSLKMQIQMGQRAIQPEKGLVPTPERLQKIFTISARQTNRLIALVDDLLDVSRIHAGKISYTFEEVNLSELVHELSERYSETGGVMTGLMMRIAPGVVGKMDRFRIEQVITNLLSNAIKYGAGKPIEVSLSADDDFARLVVQDSGMGIGKEMQSRIFNRFERGVSAANISGLGLGLYIARTIVEAHRGAIEVTSVPGEKTEFIVTLPLAGHASEVNP